MQDLFQASGSRGVQWGTPEFTAGERAMVEERRKNTADRRQQQREIGVPFKDSNGATVRVERRFIPDRRINNEKPAAAGSNEVTQTS